MAPQKGKQGTKGQKQIVEENAETLKFYLQMALAVNAVYYGLAFTVLNDCFTWMNIPQKGKQGTKGQKQIVEENAETLKFYLQMALAVNAVYYGLAFTVLNDCFTWMNIPQKGKQGTKGQKQIVEENAETLKFYLQMALAVNAVYYGLAFTVLNDCFTWMNIVMLVVSTATFVACYQFMAYISLPKYTATGQLVDSGVDLNMEGGLSEHVKDLIILTSAVQSLSLVSNYFWFLLLLAPGRAVQLTWANIISPYIFQQQPQSEEMSEKKQRKLTRKEKKFM